MYRPDDPAETGIVFLEHLFAQDDGHAVTLTGRQARLDRDDARANELHRVEQCYWRYPGQTPGLLAYLQCQSAAGRDAYIAVHLFREPGNRRASNAMPTVRCLWLDEDDGHYLGDGPEPTAVVRSSAGRRHLYWRLTQPVTVEWAVEMNRRIAHWAAGDSGKAALASVLQVPGTMNFKRHPQVDTVDLELGVTPAWEPETLDQAVPELPGGATGNAALKNAAFHYDGSEVDLEPYLEEVAVLGESPDELGVKYAIVCPWVHEHTGGDRTGTYVGQREGGGMWFWCNHDHCAGRAWRDFKRAVRWTRRNTLDLPGYTGPPLRMEIRHD